MSRPQTFEKVDDCVKWYLKTGMVKNKESARICTEAQLEQMESGLY